MWKAFSRSVCEVVERRVGFTAFRSDVSNKNRTDASQHRKVSCHGQISHFIPQLKTYCPLKHLKVIRHKVTGHEHAGDKRHQRTRHHARWNDPPINACLGAMGWSTALVIGFYLSQPLGRRLFGESHFREIRLHAPHRLSIGRAVYAQSPIEPLAIRPLSYSSAIDEDESCAGSFHSSFTSSSSDLDDVFTHQRGPFTPEEALNEVSKIFEEASRALSGDVENKLGMVCIEKGQHSEAIKHFRRASHHEHAVAAYNLGQCYELGLGTPRNLKKAAKWYKVGSDRGHPTAMYNLAVFLANGWGGLVEDQSRARELLIMASSLGLQEAKDALRSMESSHSEQMSRGRNQKVKDPTEEFLELIGATAQKQLTESESTEQRYPPYLSHLDWLDLSSSSYSTSEDRSRSSSLLSSEENDLFSSLCLESEWSFSCSHHGRLMKIKNKNGETFYQIRERLESSSSGAEFIDEAANLKIYQKPVDCVA